MANMLEHYAGYIDGELQKFNRADNLPLLATKREIRARKLAFDIINPIKEALLLYANQYNNEAELETQMEEMGTIPYDSPFG
jgi:hypothetical protein